MHQQHPTKREAIPIQAAPPDDVTEARILALLLSLYGPTLSSRELRKVTKVSRSSEGNYRNRRHKRFNADYPRGFPLFDAANSPRAFWTADAARWLAKRANNNINFAQV